MAVTKTSTEMPGQAGVERKPLRWTPEPFWDILASLAGMMLHKTQVRQPMMHSHDVRRLLTSIMPYRWSLVGTLLCLLMQSATSRSEERRVGKECRL